MITYNSSLAMIFYVRTGSVVLVSSAWALLAAFLTAACFVAKDPRLVGIAAPADADGSSAAMDYLLREYFSQPYSHYIISYMVGFLMLFRVQLSYQRYWFALEHLYESNNRLYCAAGMVIAFDEVTTGDPAIRGHAWRQHMMHLFSLLAGAQLLELRCSDQELSELQPISQLVERETTSRKGMVHNTILKAMKRDLNVPLAQEPVLFPVEIIAGVQDDEKRHLSIHAPMYDQAVNARIVRLLSKRLEEGGLDMPPPIVSRIYQELALSNAAFKQGLKIARIRFPFPYAQLLELVKFFVIIVTPLVILSKSESAVRIAQAWINCGWAMLHTFVVVFNFVAMTKVSQELEDPFGVDPNDLPLLSMHDALNFRLERLLHEESPAADFRYNLSTQLSPTSRAMGLGRKKASIGSSQQQHGGSTGEQGSPRQNGNQDVGVMAALQALRPPGLWVSDGQSTYTSISPTISSGLNTPLEGALVRNGNGAACDESERTAATSARSNCSSLPSPSPGAKWRRASVAAAALFSSSVDKQLHM
jgi:predicted membrane chloride channel (bestrophin family)